MHNPRLKPVARKSARIVLCLRATATISLFCLLTISVVAILRDSHARSDSGPVDLQLQAQFNSEAVVLEQAMNGCPQSENENVPMAVEEIQVETFQNSRGLEFVITRT